jgi:hypothetical protein
MWRVDFFRQQRQWCSSATQAHFVKWQTH